MKNNRQVENGKARAAGMAASTFGRKTWFASKAELRAKASRQDASQEIREVR